MVPPELITVTVTPCEPLLVGWLPWFFSVVVKVTVLPPAGLDGFQPVVPIRSALCTGDTVRLVELVRLLLLSLSSTSVFASSTLAVRA